MAAANYVFVAGAAADLKVDPATLSVDAKNAETVYGTAATLDYKLTGFVNSEDATSAGVTGSPSCSVTGSQNVGTHSGAISCAPGSLAAANYVFVAGAAADLKVDPATLSVDAKNAETVYGTAATLDYKLTGFVNSEDATSAGVTGSPSCSVTGSQNVGTHSGAISCAPGSLAAANYVFVAGAAADLKVDPATLSVDAKNAETVYGTAATLDYKLTGFVNSEDATSAGVTGSPSCSVTGSQNVGTHSGAISCAPGSLAAANYVFVAGAAADLKVDPATLSVDAKNAGDGVRDGGDAGLQADRFRE